MHEEPLSVEVISDPAALGSGPLSDAWRNLWSASRDASPYLSWEWASTWWRHFGGRDRLHLVVVRSGGRVRALAPLLESGFGPPGLGWRVLTGVGQETAGYGGVLLGSEPERTFPIVADHLERWLAGGRARVVNLTRLRPTGELLERLTARCAAPDAPARLACAQMETYPRLDLRLVEDRARHVSHLWKRNDVRRRWRRLGEGHDVAFTYHRPPREGGLAQFLELHDARWSEKADSPSGLFASAPGRAFVADAAEALDAAGLLRLSFVDVDGRPIVGRFGFESAGCYYGEKSGWDPAFAAYGPGHLAVGHIVAHMETAGLDVFDFMRGAGEHKRPWANSSEDVGYWTLSARDAPAWVGRAFWWHLRERTRRRAGRSLFDVGRAAVHRAVKA